MNPSVTNSTQRWRAIEIFETSDKGDGGLLPDRPTSYGTMMDGQRVSMDGIVPRENALPNPMDELRAFREARRHPAGGIYFAARVAKPIGSPRFPAGSLVVFDWNATIKDGDIVCAYSFTRRRAPGFVKRHLRDLRYSSVRLESIMDSLNLQVEEPETRSYLLRRYVVSGDSFRLESLDGSGLAITKSPLIDLEPYAAVADIRPWGYHRNVVLI